MPIPFNQTSNQQAIISAIITAIAGVPNFGVQAIQLPGTNRITLLGESVTGGATTNATGITIVGQPGVSGAAVRVPIEETYAAGLIVTAEEVGLAIATAVNATPGLAFQAGAAGNRLNFMGALTADFSGMRNPFDFPSGRRGRARINPLPRCRFPSWSAITAWKSRTASTRPSTGAAVSATQLNTTVLLDPAPPPAAQPVYVCNSFGHAAADRRRRIPGLPAAKRRRSARRHASPGWPSSGPQMYAVTNTGGLFRIASGFSGTFFSTLGNVADYIDGSQAQLQAVNDVTAVDEFYHHAVGIQRYEPRYHRRRQQRLRDGRFPDRRPADRVGNAEQRRRVYRSRRSPPGTITLAAGLAGRGNRAQRGPAADGDHRSGPVSGPRGGAARTPRTGATRICSSASRTAGRLFAFDTWGRPQAVFANASVLRRYGD